MYSISVVTQLWGSMGSHTPCSSSTSHGGRTLPSLSSTSFSHGVLFPLCGNGASLSLFSKEVTPLFPTFIVLFLLRRRVSSKCSSIWCTLALPPISFPSWMIKLGCRCPRRFLGFHIVRSFFLSHVCRFHRHSESI